MHESSLYERNSFITLTYDDEHLPPGNTLVLKHFQDFMKRLRKQFGTNIRYLHCGEYGEKFGRPHYHALIFNFDFDDKEPFFVKNGHTNYTSDTLQALWPFGHSVVGELTYESAAYVSRYTTKKNLRNYRLMDNPEAAIRGQLPGETRKINEYITMSRRPGLGRGWLEKFQQDVYPDDYVLKDGKKLPPPRYYDSVFELDNPEQFEKIKRARMHKAKQNACESSPERLSVKERLQYKRLERLQRDLTNDS